ncbi:hypothetical protein MNBD_GAMMA03-968 [hydrothermal vent metagenome]|uniref:TonB C-terminal domain-containing protein n=1 Tax=hydrothermal vent metagenome TaxID=652676 RepID=A0A3B0VXT6_9ZZZZ
MSRFTPAKKSFFIAFVLYAFLLLIGYALYSHTPAKKELPDLTEVPITLSMFQTAAPKVVKIEQPEPIKAVEPPPPSPIEKRPPPVKTPIKPPINKPIEPITTPPVNIEPKITPTRTPIKNSSPPPKASAEPVIEEQPKILPPPTPVTQSTVKPTTEPLKEPYVPSVSADQTAEAEEHYLSELNAIVAQHANNSYPKRAKRRNWQGEVFIQFTLQPNGRITQLSIVESSGRQLLDNAALQIFQVKMNQQFKPFPKEITRTKWRIKVPVSYNLR